MNPIHIIGAGLAGCEAAHQVTKHGIPVILHEMRPVKSDAAHKTNFFAELVCSNSLLYPFVASVYDAFERYQPLVLLVNHRQFFLLHM